MLSLVVYLFHKCSEVLPDRSFIDAASIRVVVSFMLVKEPLPAVVSFSVLPVSLTTDAASFLVSIL